MAAKRCSNLIRRWDRVAKVSANPSVLRVMRKDSGSTG